MAGYLDAVSDLISFFAGSSRVLDHGRLELSDVLSGIRLVGLGLLKRCDLLLAGEVDLVELFCDAGELLLELLHETVVLGLLHLALRLVDGGIAERLVLVQIRKIVFEVLACSKKLVGISLELEVSPALFSKLGNLGHAVERGLVALERQIEFLQFQKRRSDGHARSPFV